MKTLHISRLRKHQGVVLPFRPLLELLPMSCDIYVPLNAAPLNVSVSSFCSLLCRFPRDIESGSKYTQTNNYGCEYPLARKAGIPAKEDQTHENDPRVG